MKRIFTLIILLTGLALGTAKAQTTVSFPSSSPYTEDFNTTPGASGTTYPTGWRSYSNTTFDGTMTVGSQSSTTGANYNYVNRIGILGSGSTFLPGSIVLAISSTTGATSMTISYDVIKIRETATRSNTFNLEISTTSPTSGFTAIEAGAYASGTISEGTTTSFSNISISGLDNNSGPVYIRWMYSDVTGGSGSRDGIALDNVNVSWSGALPISLVKFEAEKLAEKVQLTWVTATEINNDKFIVERSANGEDFAAIAEIKGAGNSKELNEYTMVDANPFKGTAYYRLTQVDFDGTSTSFEPVAVNMNKGSLSMEQGAGSLEQGVWSIYSPIATEALIDVKDINGKVIYSEKIQLKEGYQHYKLNLTSQQTGIYVLQLIAGKESITKKLKLN